MKFSNRAKRLALCLAVCALAALPTRAAEKPTSRALPYDRGFGELSARGAFSPDGRFFGATSHNLNARTRRFLAWDTRTAKLIANWKLRYLTEFAFAPDGRAVAVISEERQRRDIGYEFSVEIRDTRYGTVRRTIIPIGKIYGGIYSVAWSADGKLLGTGSGDGLARVWNTTTGKRLAAILVGGSVSALCFSPDGRTLATVGDASSSGSRVQLWDWRNKKARATEFFPTYSHYARLSFAPDGSLLAVTNTFDAKTILRDGRTLQERARFVSPSTFGNTEAQITFSPNLRFKAWPRAGRLFVQERTPRSKATTFPLRLSGQQLLAVDIRFVPQQRRLTWATFQTGFDADGNHGLLAPRLWHASF